MVQDTWSDLLLFFSLNIILLVGLGVLKGILDEGKTPVEAHVGVPGIWLNIYEASCSHCRSAPLVESSVSSTS